MLAVARATAALCASICTLWATRSVTPESLSPSEFSRRIQEHWQIENGRHWDLDVVFDEENSSENVLPRTLTTWNACSNSCCLPPLETAHRHSIRSQRESDAIALPTHCATSGRKKRKFFSRYLGEFMDSWLNAFYRNKSILITGATGFVGSILLQTIISNLPESGLIYCIFRNETGLVHPRIKWIRGDIRMPKFGLDELTLQSLQEQVEIVFHLAAHTGWNIGLKDQVASNTLPAIHAAELASTFKKLQSFIFTSSYWSAGNRFDEIEIKEDFFQDFSAEIELSDIINRDLPARLADWPNPYSYAKNLAERILQQRFPEMPIVVARVTSVCGTWLFPERGICRFDNALPAFLRAIATGSVKYFPSGMKTAVNDAIPVDLCVNLLLTNAADRAREFCSIINCGSAKRNLPTVGSIAEMVGEIRYFDTPSELEEALSNMGDPRAEKLNRLILKTYSAGLERRVFFLDDEARRPIRKMLPSDMDIFPVEVENVDWTALVKAMMKNL